MKPERNPWDGWLLLLISLVIIALTWQGCEAQALPEPVVSDHCVRCAEKAIAGAYGPLAEWQRVGYSRLLENGARRRVAWITCYWTGEPGVNSTTASGRRVETGRTAAMLEPRSGMPWGTFVLVDLPAGYELRQVWDTGSRRNRGRAQRKGAQTWIDLYMPSRTGATYVRPIWIERYRKGRD